jgi:hypothetical protein
VGLLSPWFLGGLAALGLPIFVHLLQQYRQTPLPFSSLMFFEKRTQSSIKHRRLKYLLLFALRCLLILLLALAFARPYIHSNAIARAGSGRSFVFALDNSFSMRQDDRFNRAKQAAIAAVNTMREGDRGQVITFGGPARLVTDMIGDKQALRAALTGIDVGDDASSYAELSRALRAASESFKTDITAEVFSDAQKSSMPASFSDLRLPDGTKFNFHSVADQPVANWAVESVDAPRRVFDTKKVRTLATIASYSPQDVTRKVSLIANGKTLETKDVKVPANGRATVEFLTLDAPYGLTRCEIRIDGGDSFPADDRWYFSVERADPKPVLVIHGDNDNASTLYIRTALEAATEPAFTVESVTANQAANSNVPKYAFVILSDPGPLPQKFSEALDKFVQGGGSVLISVGRNSAQGRALPVAGIQLTTLNTVARENAPVVTVASVDNSYAAFGQGQSWAGVDFFQTGTLNVAAGAPDTRIAARFSNGLPMLVDRTIGSGHAIVFASTFDNIANNLPLQAVWLPFLEQLTHQMGGIGTARGNYRVGSYVELRSPKEKGVSVEIVGPEGKRLLTLAESTKAETFQFPAAGFYDIRRANGREELAAVNPDRRESDFALVPAETLDLWKNTGIAAKSGQTAGATGTQEENAELWWWILALLAVMAVAESVLGNRHIAAGKEAA